MNKDDLKHLLIGLGPNDLRTLRAVINGKLSTRTITTEQQRYMREAKKLRREIRRACIDHGHNIVRSKRVDFDSYSDILDFIICDQCMRAVIINKDLSIRNQVINADDNLGPHETDCGEFWMKMKRERELYE
jgi:hypothetical protein